MSTAEVIVRELISDLLYGTVLVEGNVSGSEVAKLKPMDGDDHCDIVTLLQLHCQARIISGFSLRRNRVEVIQLRCVEQRASGK